MRRWPLVPTLVVTLAVAAMVALGLWQLLDRLPRKLAYLDQLRANPTMPAIAMPQGADELALFRRASTTCRPPATIRLAGAGAAGFRAIATCADGTLVQLGTTRDPNAKPVWHGGPVAGYVGHAPDGRSLIETAIRRQPQHLMLVAATPPAGLAGPTGLAANAPPDLDSVPNNHLAYAVQWFFFAGLAAIIYVLAVGRRAR